MASQMTPAILEMTRVDCVPPDAPEAYVFRANGTVMKFAGHTIVYREGTESKRPMRPGPARQSQKTRTIDSFRC